MNRYYIAEVCFLILSIFAVKTNAQWTKVYGTNVNNSIIHEMMIFQGSFFAGTNGQLLKSDNKGETWNNLSINASGIAALESDGSRLFAGVIFSFEGKSIYYSDDNGTTWNASDLSAGQVTEILYVNPNLMYAYSSFQKFFQSNDRGVTWNEVNHFPFKNTRSMFKSSSGRLYISGYYSDDDGQTWNQTGYDRDGSGIFTYAENKDELWVGAGKLWLSNDNGESWEEKDPYLTASLIVNGDNVFQGKNGFAYSVDGGEIFTDYNEGITNIDRVLSMIFDGEFILIGMNGPGIYKMKASELGIATSVEEENAIANDYCLYQNYPNPFNPATVIRFSIPQSGSVSLKIYDILGREVAELINAELNAGSYSVEFNAGESEGSLASGIYLYRLETNNYVQTKKLMLIK